MFKHVSFHYWQHISCAQSTQKPCSNIGQEYYLEHVICSVTHSLPNPVQNIAVFHNLFIFLINSIDWVFETKSRHIHNLPYLLSLDDIANDLIIKKNLLLNSNPEGNITM